MTLNESDYNFLNEAEFKRENIARVMTLYRKLFGKYFGGEFKILAEEEYKKPQERGSGIRLINDLNYQLRFNWAFKESNELKKQNQKDKTKLFISSIDYWEPTNTDFEKPSTSVKLLANINVVQIWKGLARVIKKGIRGKYTLNDLKVDAQDIAESKQTKKSFRDLISEDYNLTGHQRADFLSQNTKMSYSTARTNVSKDRFNQMIDKDPELKAKLNDYVAEINIGKKETNTTAENLNKLNKELDDKVYCDPEYVFQDIEDMAELVAKGRCKSLVICGQAGVGKCLTNDTDVITPNGKIKISDIKPGDEVITPKNTIAKVVEVYPQPEQKDCYRVHFKDGRYVDCDEEQLFKVAIQKGHTNLKFEILTLSQIMERIDKSKYIKNFKGVVIPYCEPISVNCQKEDLPLDPYILGLLIGDGSLTHDVGFSNNSVQTIEFFRNFLNENYPGYDLKYNSGVDYSVVQTNFNPKGKSREESKNIFKIIMKDLGLFGKNSHTKFIPEIYKNSSIEQKLELVRGLMDTDGYISNCGSSAHTLYTTVSKQLSRDFAEIIWSLGGRAKIREKRVKYLESYRTYFDVSFALPFKMGMVVKNNELKVERYQKRIQSNKFRQHQKIIDIEYIGKKDTTCILIDDPEHLFLVNDYVVVHNTFHITSKLKQLLGDQSGKWFYHSGMKASPVSFYNKTFEERNGIIVWDEADSLLKNDDIVMMLKPALDTNGDNTMEYSRGKSMTGMSKEEIEAYAREVDAMIAGGKILGPVPTKGEYVQVPGKFYFKGSMIFISNMPAKSIESAILSRSIFIDVKLCASDINKRIMSIMKIKHKQYSDEQLDEFANALGGFATSSEPVKYMTSEYARKNKPVTIRSMELAIQMKEAGLKNWARLASLYA